MPVHLKAVITLITIDIVSRAFGIVKFSNITEPSTYVFRLASIIMSVIIIKGFLKRSNISRKLAICIAIFYLLASTISIYIISKVPLPEGETKIEYLLPLAVILIKIYILYALLSKKVVDYFTGGTMDGHNEH